MLKFIIYCLNVLAAVGGFREVFTTSEPAELKEVVAIQIDGVPKCLGAFVVTEVDLEPRFVATAAHCVYGVQTSRLTLKEVKRVQLQQPQVRRVMVHPYYMPPSPDYDIALLKISNSTGEGGLLLTDKLSSDTDIQMKAFDWDLNEDINATLEERQSCRAKMVNHTIVSKRMLCVNTGSKSVVDGSPLIQLAQNKNHSAEKYIVGIGSYYVRKNGEKYPKIFTSTTNSEIYSFIEKYID